MKRTFSIPLRLLIPALLVGCSTVAGVISWTLNTRQIAREIEAQYLEEAKLRAGAARATIEYLLGKGDPEGVELEVAGMGTRRDVLGAYVLDDEDRILAATKPSVIGQGAPAIEVDLPADLKMQQRGQLANTRATAKETTILSKDRGTALATHPFRINDVISGPKTGMLLLVLDVNVAKGRALRAAGRQAVEHALVFGGLAAIAWALLHLSLTRRLARLVATTQQLAVGDLTARTNMAGADELTQVGCAVDMMVKVIAGNALHRKQTVETLQRQQTELRVLFDFIPAMVCFKDTKGNIQRANQRLADALGKTVGEIEGKPSSEIFPKEAARFYEDDLEVFRSKQAKLGIVEMFHDREGHELWIQTDKVPVCDAGGNVTGLVAMAQDISERQRAQADSRWKTAFLEAQVKSSLDGILVVDEKGRKILQNQRTIELFKIPPEVADDPDDKVQRHAVMRGMKYPERFLEKVAYLNTHPEEVSRDELELKDGTILDRYSAPVIGDDATYYGRIWTFRDVTEQKRIEKALERQTGELRILFDLLPAMVCFKDTQNGIVRVNRHAAAHLGRSVEEIEGHTLFEIDPQRAERAYEADLEVIESGVPRLGEIETARSPAGKELWLQKDTVPVFDTQGHAMGVIVMTQDITEQLTDEEKLQRQQVELRILFDLMPAMIWFKDTRNGILRVNQRVADAAGKTVEEIEGRPSEEIYPEEAAKFYADDLEVIRSGVAKLGYVEAMPGTDDQTLWVQVDKVPYRDRDGQVIGIVVMSQDVTERKRTDESLRLLGSAVEQSNESIMITDADLDAPGPRILFVNPAFTQMTGYTSEEAIGKTPRILQGPLTDRAVLGRLRENLQRGEVFAGEAMNYRKDGGIFALEWQVAPLRNEAEVITHFVAIQHDITERKRLEAQLIQSQKLETVGRLAGGIAHEFNSILTAILGQGELLLNALPAASPLAKSAIEISRAANRAATLTRQLLAYGRKQRLEPSTLDLSQIVEGMTGMLTSLMGGEVQIRIIKASDLWLVRADAGQIEQVVTNMAMNAREAMPRGGDLTLETENVTLDAEAAGDLPGLAPGDYAVLTISDTGTGLSEVAQARAFEPFFSTKAVGEGTGLGLSTCYGIIKQSGGHIGLWSEPGKGARFKIYLPRVEPEAAEAAAEPGAAGLLRGTETILVVEEDPALREMAGMLLQRLGYSVLTAGLGEDALRMRSQRNDGLIDMLITDVVLGDMSGAELADRVRTRSPQAEVLFSSAYPNPAGGDGEKGIHFLRKPFTPSALVRKLREVLDGRAAMEKPTEML